MAAPWTDSRGDEHAPCALCGVDCSTHPDAANPLAPCQDCGRATCLDHRVADAADCCVDCAAEYDAAGSPGGGLMAAPVLVAGVAGVAAAWAAGTLAAWAWWQLRAARAALVAADRRMGR